jgi:signal transduction histidine kinase
MPQRPRDENAPSSPGARVATGSRGQEAGQDESLSLLAAVAHQLSQPLTALRGTLELACFKARSAAEYRSAIEKALESAEHLAWLVESLRELAEAEALAGDPALTDLAQVTESALEDLRPLAAMRGVLIESQVGKGLQTQTYPEHLYQALVKVVHYAILHSPPGKKVRMELRSVQEGAAWSVAGEGTSFSLLGTEHFPGTAFRGQGQPENPGGSLLGLLMAKRFIEALGGSLSAESPAEEGNRILICLPVSSRTTP